MGDSWRSNSPDQVFHATLDLATKSEVGTEPLSKAVKALLGES